MSSKQGTRRQCLETAPYAPIEDILGDDVSLDHVLRLH